MKKWKPYVLVRAGEWKKNLTRPGRRKQAYFFFRPDSYNSQVNFSYSRRYDGSSTAMMIDVVLCYISEDVSTTGSTEYICRSIGNE